MKVLWLSWKDYEHPLAGGAEVVLRELNQRLARDGHEVTILTASYNGATKVSRLDDHVIVRVGRNRYVHSFRALAHYLRRYRNKFDVVIEVVNTAPYFSALFGGSTPIYLFYHQLAREIWFYEAPFPLNRVGFHFLEPFASRLLARKNPKVITVSDSTKQDLVRYGFQPDNISIISEGSDIQPIAQLESSQKNTQPTILSLGAIRPMKRTLDQVKAFELAKQDIPDLRLILAGDNSGTYGGEVISYCQRSPFSDDIMCLGRVNAQEKLELMQRAHAILATSVKEGWGLTVTEAASQGTPAVAYDVDGLRDSVRHTQTGIVTEPQPTALAKGITQLLTDETLYQKMRRKGWEWSKTITFDQCYKDFKEVVMA